MEKQTKFHIGLHVSDISSTIAFYEKLFNQKPIKTKEDYAKFELENPGLVISFQRSSEVHNQFGHMGYRVADNQRLDEVRERVEGKLPITLEEKEVACCYAVQNKFWVSDPDGHRWEVYFVIEDTEVNDEAKLESACC